MGDAKMRHTSMFLLLANLAFNDFCYLFVAFVAYFCKANASTWGGLYASAAFYLKRVSILVSALTSVAICLERYFAIVHPLRCRALFRPSRAIIHIAAVWIVGCSLNIFYLAIIMDKLFIPYGAWRYAGSLFVAVDMVIVYIAPIITMTIFYTKTCRTLWQSSTTQQATGGPALRSAEVLSPNSHPRNTSKVASRRAVVKMLIICVVVFYGCYSLYGMYWFLKSFLVYVPYDDIWLGLGMLAIDIACAKFLLWLGVVGTSFGAAATAFAVVQATLAYDRIAFAAFSILLLTAHLTVLIMHWLQKWWLLHALCIAPITVLFVFHARFALTAFWEEEFSQYSALIGGAKCGLLLLLALINLLCCQAVRRAKVCISEASAPRDASTEASTATTRS
ncbi:Galanin receptor type 2 [Aphelenchoides avenae]|nr:Galanin receptor type 2 [Aphelenchus avenae]